MRLFVEGVGLRGPGLDGWNASRATLRGTEEYRPGPIVVPPSTLLPAAERRRTVGTVRLALAVGAEALAEAGREPEATASVFASSGGDGETIHAILETLASPAAEISPTRFHNSVHNAASGYWTIATGARAPSTSLCGYDWSFAAGFLDAAAQAVVDDRPMLLVCYDLPYPAPIRSVRRVESPFGVALVLTPQRTPRALARLDLELQQTQADATPMAAIALERLRLDNPAARALPLLAAVAQGDPRTIVFATASALRLVVSVAPP